MYPLREVIVSLLACLLQLLTVVSVKLLAEVFTMLRRFFDTMESYDVRGELGLK